MITLKSRTNKVTDNSSKAKKDMHKTNIVMLAIRDQPGEGNQASTSTLLSLCSQGVLAEWQVSRGEEDMEIDEAKSGDFQAINCWKLDIGATEELGGKIRHA